jgi:transcriptional regulator with XRE-family HTH domain
MRRLLAWRRAVVDVLRRRRVKMGYSQRGLSKKLGMHITYIWEVEHYQHSMRVDELLAICDELQMEEEEIVKLILRARRSPH